MSKREFWGRVEAAKRQAALKGARFPADTPEKKLRRMAEAIVLPERFNATYLPHYFKGPGADFHLELYRALEVSRRTVVRAPRGHAKSTVITFAYTLHQVACADFLRRWVREDRQGIAPELVEAVLEVMGEEIARRRQAAVAKHTAAVQANPKQAHPNSTASKEMRAELEWLKGLNGVLPLHYDPYIQIISVTVDQAEEFTSAIKLEVEENELIRSDWGDLVGRRQWREADWVSGTGVRVKAFGMRGSIRGGKHLQDRPTLAIFDDPDSEETVTTLGMRERQRRKVTGAVAYGLEPKVSRVFMIGTPVHADCIVCHVSAKKESGKGFKRWTVLRFRAGLYDGKPLWAARWSLEALAAERDDDPETYDMEMEDIAPNDEANPFKVIVEYEAEEIPGYDELFTILVFDPSYGQSKDSDLQAVLVLKGPTKSGDLLVHRAEGLRIADPDALELRVHEIHAEEQPGLSAVEAIGGGQFVAALLDSRADKRCLLVGWVRITRQDAPKAVRFLSPASLMNRGKIKLRKGHHTAPLRRQILDYPHGKVDLIDTLEMGQRLARGRVAGVFNARKVRHGRRRTASLGRHFGGEGARAW